MKRTSVLELVVSSRGSGAAHVRDVARVMEASFHIEQVKTYRFSLPSSLSRVPGLVRLLGWIECRLIRLPGIRQWGDIIVVIAYKP